MELNQDRMALRNLTTVRRRSTLYEYDYLELGVNPVLRPDAHSYYKGTNSSA
jgi:hypothetical protein